MICVGCQEQPGTIRAPGLGRVCEACHEVAALIAEAEAQKVRRALAALDRVLAAFDVAALREMP